MLRVAVLLSFLCSPAIAAKAPPKKLVLQAASGDAAAQDRLGMWYDDNGYGITAVSWYRKAAAQGYTNGLHHMGVMLEGGAEASGVAQDCAGSRDYYQRAIAKGYAASMFRVGYQYYRGVCAPKDDAQARDWFKRSGTGAGLFYMGLIDESAGNLASAAGLYEQAFENGSIAAANQRAHLYYDGTPRDAEKAYTWYLRGAAMADAEDRRRLAALKKELRR